MAFRRRFRRRFSRRARGRETYTIRECRQCQNVWYPSTCSSPITDVMELFGMHMPKGLGDSTEVSSGGDRFVIIDGISFQSEHLFDPNEARGGTDPGDNPQVFDAAFWLTIWEAIVVLPYGQGSQIPAYFPNFTSGGVGQSADLADRVLWKRLTTMPLWNVNINGGIFPFPQLMDTGTLTSAGPQRVKTKVRLDDRHGLYYVRNFVHDVLITPPPSIPQPEDCGILEPILGVEPILNDSWWKIFYHTRK